MLRRLMKWIRVSINLGLLRKCVDRGVDFGLVLFEVVFIMLSARSIMIVLYVIKW